jgi:hypothetical protein
LYVVDGVLGALVPAVRISHREDNPRSRAPFHQFLIEGGAGPVYSGPADAEELFPVDGFPACRCFPRPHVPRVGEHLGHVVTGAGA